MFIFKPFKLKLEIKKIANTILFGTNYDYF